MTSILVSYLLSGFWKWNQAWVLPKKAGIAGAIQAMMAISLFYYINQYPHLSQFLFIISSLTFSYQLFDYWRVGE